MDVDALDSIGEGLLNDDLDSLRGRGAPAGDIPQVLRAETDYADI